MTFTSLWKAMSNLPFLVISAVLFWCCQWHRNYTHAITYCRFIQGYAFNIYMCCLLVVHKHYMCNLIKKKNIVEFSLNNGHWDKLQAKLLGKQSYVRLPEWSWKQISQSKHWNACYHEAEFVISILNQGVMY